MARQRIRRRRTGPRDLLRDYWSSDHSYPAAGRRDQYRPDRIVGRHLVEHASRPHEERHKYPCGAVTGMPRQRRPRTPGIRTQSARRAARGSKRAARWAGMMQAVNMTIASKSATGRRTSGLAKRTLMRPLKKTASHAIVQTMPKVRPSIIC